MLQAFAKLLRHSPGKSDFRVTAACCKEIKALFALHTPSPPFNVAPCYFDSHLEILTTLIGGGGGRCCSWEGEIWAKIYSVSSFLRLLVATIPQVPFSPDSFSSATFPFLFPVHPVHTPSFLQPLFIQHTGYPNILRVFMDLNGEKKFLHLHHQQGLSLLLLRQL